MTKGRRQFGFTLTEALVVLAVVLILISATARLGQFIRQRSTVQLAASALAVIDVALQQYYSEFGAFPFVTDIDALNGHPKPYTKDDLQADLAAYFGVGLAAVTLNHPDFLERDGSDIENYHSFASSAGLYWFLHRSPDSRPIVDALAAFLVTTEHPQDATQRLSVTAGGTTYDLPRFVDPWGTSLWYRYEVGYSFPRVISAGPDRVFGTPDDIENK